MTRPMPGPHEHHWTTWYYACTACSGLWDRGDEAQRLDKHLTDAECAAEMWRAEAEVLYFDPDAEPARWSEAVTRQDAWHRFATLPHAFKETP